MSLWLFALLSLTLTGSPIAKSQDLPTVYQYYTEGGINSGLEAKQDGFFLNGKNINIYSGAIHYFRIHPQYWRDRLRKLRAAGFIAVETYAPWNLHEPELDTYDFGNGNNEFSEFLDIRTFLKLAQEEDLFVILRPGPYICAEWVMGGLPSWLLRFPDIKMRTSDSIYTERVRLYFSKLLPLVQDLQFTNNGSIIAVQLENEFSSVSYPAGPDDQHLRDLQVIVRENGIREFLFTSDSFILPKGTIEGVLRTINLQDDPLAKIAWLKIGQPNLPVMVMEYWTGWYDHWFTPTSGRNDFTPEDFGNNLEIILKYPASVNLYMFIGGTSWGFMNGANAVINKASTGFDITSYDYGAPLTEAGDYTEKYFIAKDLIAAYQQVQFLTPDMPEISKKIAYPSVQITEFMDLEALYRNAGPPISSISVVNMEELDTNNRSGQSYGYVWYRKNNITLNSGDIVTISGHIHDAAQIFVDGKLQTKVLESESDIEGFGYWKLSDGQLELLDSGLTLDILVENLGRVNFGLITYSDKKGLYDGPVTLNGLEITDWEIESLEFKKKWVQGLKQDQWNSFTDSNGTVAPGLYRGNLNLSTDSDPSDTFILTEGWTKGIIIINGFNLGRYNKVGPQKSLYLPGPLLKRGANEIILFEQFIPSNTVTFADEPLW